MNIKQEIPIFFSCDDNYVPYLNVAIYSLIKNSSKNNNYSVIILNTGMSKENQEELKQMETENVKISFEDVSEKLRKINEELKLRLRDYYSVAIYYRLFIPSLFPVYEKAIYLDADTIILDDIANLYNMNMGDNLLMAVTDATVDGNEDFRRYAKFAFGLDRKKYINSGMLVMNLREMRKANIEQKFIYLLLKYNLETAAPDQDYLNILCRDRIKCIGAEWNLMPDFNQGLPEESLHIIHYNMFRKPWHYDDVPYKEIFWRYAKETKYYDELRKMLSTYTDKQKKEDLEGTQNLIDLTKHIIKQDIKFIDVIDETLYIDLDEDIEIEEFIDNLGLI